VHGSLLSPETRRHERLHLVCDFAILAHSAAEILNEAPPPGATTLALIFLSDSTNRVRLRGDFSVAGSRLSQWPFGPTGRPRCADRAGDVGSGFFDRVSMK
jgi:hypothetical protein